MSSDIITLSSGTEHTELITLPMCGLEWAGQPRVRLSTHTQAATLHEWVFIAPDSPDGKIWYRRTGVTSENNWYNTQLKPDTEILRWLGHYEALMRITYTSAHPISLMFETIKHKPFLSRPSLPEWNKKDAEGKLWDSNNPNNNLTPGNPTERTTKFFSNNNGVTYWVNKE